MYYAELYEILDNEIECDKIWLARTDECQDWIVTLERRAFSRSS